MNLSIGKKDHDENTEAVFDEIFRAYHQDVYRLAFHLTQKKEDTEDLFQDTWLRVAGNIHMTTAIRDIKAWIFTIVVNRFRDQLRKKKLRSVFVPGPRNESEPPVQDSDADWQISIAQAIARLPQKQRIVFVLKEMEGFKYEEIARMLDKPTGTVKSQLHRALLQLRKELTPKEKSRL